MKFWWGKFQLSDHGHITDRRKTGSNSNIVISKLIWIKISCNKKSKKIKLKLGELQVTVQCHISEHWVNELNSIMLREALHKRCIWNKLW